jgi:hypothetical protein
MSESKIAADAADNNFVHIKIHLSRFWMLPHRPRFSVASAGKLVQLAVKNIEPTPRSSIIMLAPSPGEPLR